MRTLTVLRYMAAGALVGTASVGMFVGNVEVQSLGMEAKTIGAFLGAFLLLILAVKYKLP